MTHPIWFFFIHAVEKSTHQLVRVGETAVGKEEDLLAGLSQTIKHIRKLGSALDELINHLNGLVLQLAIVATAGVPKPHRRVIEKPKTLRLRQRLPLLLWVFV